jgi:uncharacterized membrane protein
MENSTNLYKNIFIGILLLIIAWGIFDGYTEDVNDYVIRDAEAKIAENKKQSSIKDSTYKVIIAEKDSILTSVRAELISNKSNIKIKYEKARTNIINLSDDESVSMLRDNLSAGK